MINKHKGGGIISDLQNIQSELAYTTDDTYLFNYKNKERDLEKLLYKLSKYEKHCKKKRKNKIKKQKEVQEEAQEEEIHNIKVKKTQKKHSRKESEQKQKKEKIKKKITEKNAKSKIKETVDNVESEQKTKKKTKKDKKRKSEVKKILDNVESEEKTVNIKKMLKNNGIKTLSGGGDNNSYFENIPNLLFIPIIGPILFENNKINIDNNNNLVNDLLLFIASHILNILELYCIIDLIINKDNITVDKLLVIFTVLVIRILSSISVYKKKQKDNLNLNDKKNNKTTDKKNNNMNNFILSFIIIIPVFIVLFNIEKYDMSDNIILSLITILFLPYLRLLYNNMNKYDFNDDTARWINILRFN